MHIKGVHVGLDSKGGVEQTLTKLGIVKVIQQETNRIFLPNNSCVVVTESIYTKFVHNFHRII